MPKPQTWMQMDSSETSPRVPKSLQAVAKQRQPTNPKLFLAPELPTTNHKTGKKNEANKPRQHVVLPWAHPNVNLFYHVFNAVGYAAMRYMRIRWSQTLLNDVSSSMFTCMCTNTLHLASCFLNLFFQDVQPRFKICLGNIGVGSLQNTHVIFQRIVHVSMISCTCMAPACLRLALMDGSEQKANRNAFQAFTCKRKLTSLHSCLLASERC